MRLSYWLSNHLLSYHAISPPLSKDITAGKLSFQKKKNRILLTTTTTTTTNTTAPPAAPVNMQRKETKETSKVCPQCSKSITASNLSRHMKLMHGGEAQQQQQTEEGGGGGGGGVVDTTSEFLLHTDEEEEEGGEAEVQEAPTLAVHQDAARFTSVLHLFFANQLTHRVAAEAVATVRVAEHYLRYALQQPNKPGPTAGASEVDVLLLQVDLYPGWLQTGTLGANKPGTRKAYLSRFIRFLNWRLTQVGHLLDPTAAAVREATRGLLHHLQGLKREETKKARADQRERLTKEEHVKHKRWCTVKNLVDALRVNRRQFDACVQAAAAAGDMRLADRSFCTSYVLSAVSVLAPPARPGFWQALDIGAFRKAAASKDKVLSSSKFKTKEKYGVKAVQVPEDVIHIIQAYCEHVRPYCRSQSGVLAGIKLEAAGTDPLFLNPLAGGRLTSMSCKVGAHR